MAMSDSRLAFKDCYELYEKALDDPKGIKVKFPTHDDAWHFRHRLHHARILDRRDNKRVFDEDHPMHGLSEYDKITIRVTRTDDGAWLRMTRIDAKLYKIVSLTEEEISPTPPIKPRVIEKILAPAAKMRR